MQNAADYNDVQSNLNSVIFLPPVPTIGVINCITSMTAQIALGNFLNISSRIM